MIGVPPLTAVRVSGDGAFNFRPTAIFLFALTYANLLDFSVEWPVLQFYFL